MPPKSSETERVSESVARRLKLYLPLLRLWKFKDKRELTTSLISEFIGIPLEVVLADFALCPSCNKLPDENIEIDDLIDCINHLLGLKEFKECLLIGAGRLGTSLLKNETIIGSGLKIVAAFDQDPHKLGSIIAGIKIQNIEKLPATVRQMHLKMAMIATTPENALKAAENAIDSGINVIWNFTITIIPESPGLIVQNTTDPALLNKDYEKILARL